MSLVASSSLTGLRPADAQLLEQVNFDVKRQDWAPAPFGNRFAIFNKAGDARLLLYGRDDEGSQDGPMVALFSHYADRNRRNGGAIWWPEPTDVAGGFDTTFEYQTATANRDSYRGNGIALVLRNVKETTGTDLFDKDAETGVNVPNSIAVGVRTWGPSSVPLGQVVALYYPKFNNPSSEFRNLRIDYSNTPGAQNAGTLMGIPPTTLGKHTVRARYTPPLLQVWFDGNQIISNDTSFHQQVQANLNGQDGKGAYIGLVAGQGPDTETFVGSLHYVFAWSFRNLNIPPTFPTDYSEVFTFTSKGTSIFGPFNGSVKGEWNAVRAFNERFSDSASAKFPPVVGPNFGVKSTGSAKGTVGIRAEASADGGTIDLKYPGRLTLRGPDQFSIDPGATFRISSLFQAEPDARLTTSNPRANFNASLVVNDWSIYLNMGLTAFSTTVFDKEIIDLNIDGENTVTFFDTDWLFTKEAQSLLAWGGITFLPGTSDEEYEANKNKSRRASFALQDGEGGSSEGYAEKQRKGYRGEKGKGTSDGSKKGKSPLNYITGEIKLPDLGTTLSIDPDNFTSLIGTVTDPEIISFHADYTSAIVEAIPVAGPFLAPLLNNDTELYIPTLGTASFGWHLVDLYGMLTYGMKIDHRLRVHPELKFKWADSEGNHGEVSGHLIEGGKGFTDSDAFTMPDGVITITPYVTLKPEMETSPSILTRTNIRFNPLSAYLDMPKVDTIDYALVKGDLAIYDTKWPFLSQFVQPIPIPLDPFPLPVDQEEIVGRPFTIYPRTASNAPVPYIETVTPSRTPARQPASLTLKGANFAPFNNVTRYRVVFNVGQPDEAYPELTQRTATQVSVSIPDLWLQRAGTKTLSVQTLNNDNTVARTSNAVTIQAAFPEPVNVACFVLDKDSNLLNLSDIKTGPQPKDSLSGNNLLSSEKGTDGIVRQFIRFALFGTAVDTERTQIRWTQPTPEGRIVHLLPVEEWGPIVFGAQKAIFKVPAEIVLRVGEYEVQFYTPPAVTPQDGGISRAKQVNVVNPAPELHRLGQSQVYAGTPGTKITLSGRDFMPTTRALWNNQPRPTTYLSSSEIQMELLENDLSTLRIGRISVATPGPGGGKSVSLPLKVGATNRPLFQILPTATADDNGISISLVLRNVSSIPAENVTIALVEATRKDKQSFRAGVEKMPLIIGTIEKGNKVTVSNLRLPAEAGKKDDELTLFISGSNSNGSFTSTVRVKIQ